MTMPQFLIITPCLDCVSTIDETILSVASQYGRFSLHYHVQDGGSGDGALEKIQDWRDRIQENRFPIGCEDFRFTFQSESDTGMYDALNRGFALAEDYDGQLVMGWLNADDRLQPGALAAVAAILDKHADVEWLGGRHNYMDEAGGPIAQLEVQPYDRELLALGLYEGRKLFFLQQEGVFWRKSLWDRCGRGLRTDLKLAGDFELWQRFAAHAPYVSVDAALAAFRTRVGQASSDMDAYYREVDQCVEPVAEKRDELWRQMGEDSESGRQLRKSFEGSVAVYDGHERSWRLETRKCELDGYFVRPEGLFSIRMNVAEDERWMGGMVYIENLLRLLSHLPESERPAVHLNIGAGGHSEYSKRLTSYPVVASYNFNPAPGGNSTGPAAFVQKVRRRLGRYKRMMAPKPPWPDITFPVFEKAADDKSAMYWIPDFQHKHLPYAFTEAELESRDRTFKAISKCKGILLVSSRSALKDFVTFFPGSRIQPRVWSFCSNLSLEPGRHGIDPIGEYGLPRKYLYLPNQFWKHKDHMTVFQSLVLLRDQGVAPFVVCTGFQDDYRDPDFFPSILRYLEEEGLNEQVRLLGVVPRDHQVEVFRYAAAVLQPSLFEGWSTVIEDAKAVGRPIIASDLPVHLEQLEGMPDIWFHERSSPEDLARVLTELWPVLPPGPDADAEETARRRTNQRRQEAGREFMNIAREAAAVYQSGGQDR
jgi:glycosyltransferase involved in cell wall biosynthesis